MSHTWKHTAAMWAAAVAGILVIGGIDYSSGIELRVFVLYYAPVGLVAWYRGRIDALVAAVLCAITWAGFNLLAGLRFSHPAIWASNALLLGVSCAIVGLLIATLRRALMRARTLSRTDPLTSLLNTRAFYEEADRILALCRRHDRPATLAYIDLDNFKTINETLGHQAGDDLLRRIANLLATCTRPSDVCARLGGDEFALLLPEVGSREGGAALERLRKLFADAAPSAASAVTTSIGAVTFKVVPDDVQEMVRRADARMSAAKTGGKNRVHLEVAGLKPDEEDEKKR